MALTYVVKLLIAWAAWFWGLFIIPMLCLVTPRGAKRWCWLDDIYGNRVDGLDGDPRWPARYFRRYRWTALRNPINTLLRHFGPHDIVREVRRHTAKDRIEIYAKMGNGKTYWLHGRKVLGWWLVAGYALWSDPRLNSALTAGHWFENRMLVWPFRKSMPVVGDGGKDGTIGVEKSSDAD